MANTKSKAVEATSISNPTKTSESDQAVAAPKQEKQSQLATILIGLLIVASGLLIYNYFQASSAPQTTTVTDSGQPTDQTQHQDDSKTEVPDGTDKPTPSTAKEGQYTAVAGDSLWSISEQVYGDGFRWPEIAQANQFRLDAAGRPVVVAGQTITVPNSAASTAIEKPDSSLNQPTAGKLTNYTVNHGDSLWSISEQVYGDGFQWIKIFNDPSNRIGLLPNGRPLIHAGNVLHIPR